jgi:hypothetical protein
MTSPSESKTAAINSHKTRHILQADATSTVAGGTSDIAFDGEYIFAVEGVMDTAEPKLYCQRSGTDGFDLLLDSSGNDTGLNASGKAVTVQLSRGDKVYSQSTVVGGSTSYTTVLNLTTV